MADIELKRTPGDRRLYALEGVGTLRMQGRGSHKAIAEAGAGSWRIVRRRFMHPVIQATDAAGTAVGEYQPRTFHRGGKLRWADRELTLRPAASRGLKRWLERYALADGDDELAILDGEGWVVSVDDRAAVEPGLLLFAIFVVVELAWVADAAG